jgi:2-phosphosulfolactate phosphatase
MKFRYTTLETCSRVKSAVVVIDVLRAFSTAAYAFGAGAESITLVSDVREALELRSAMPGSLVMGEVGGIKVEAFDFGNSPAEFLNINLSGKALIQRTSAGTQGIVRARQAKTLLAASLCCAGATARYIRRVAPASIAFVITGAGPGEDGDEDLACAHYLEALLSGEPVTSEAYLQRVLQSPAGSIFTDPEQPDFTPLDLELCMQVDRFDFAMYVERANGRLVMRPI